MNHVSSVGSSGLNPWLLGRPQFPGDDLPLGSAARGGKTGRKNILALLVEDNRPDALLVEEAVALYGLPIDLLVLEDGAKAFEFIERADRDPEAPCPQMLLLDLNLPKRSGREVLQRLRESAKFKDIPVLIISSSNSERDRKDLRELGAEHYFCKPANYDEFLKVGEVLESMLQQHKI